MAFNNFYAGYNTYQPYSGYQQFNNSVQPTTQIQNGGFVSVRSAQEAFNYPVALGNSVTFKDETAPYIYVKTRGFSQLEEPVFEQFQLVKVNNAQKAAEMPVQAVETQSNKVDECALKSDTAALWGEIKALKEQIKILSEAKENAEKLERNATLSAVSKQSD